MTWSDIPFRPNTRTLRQFAAGCLFILTGAGALQYFAHGRHALGMGFMIVGAALGVIGLIQPRIVRPVFVGWMVLAFPLGWIISHCMMGLMYYVILTPVALFLKLRGRDQLGLRKESQTLWIPTVPPKDVKSYFRQY